jgi:hypothetical protein
MNDLRVNINKNSQVFSRSEPLATPLPRRLRYYVSLVPTRASHTNTTTSSDTHIGPYTRSHSPATVVATEKTSV